MWHGGRDEMRSDCLRKGRNGDTGYAARDMARRVKWADPALRREREGARVREREKERTRARGDARARREREREGEHARVEDACTRRERERKNESREHSREGAREAGEGERTRVREHARERARMSKRGTEKRRRGRTAPAQQRQQWGLRGRGLERRRDTAGRRGSTRWMCLLDCGPQRDDAGELLPSPALFAEEAVGEGLWDAGVHDKIFHRSRQRTDAFQGDGAIFFSESLNRRLLRP